MADAQITYRIKSRLTQPNDIRCPKCTRKGFVRFEHVISGLNTTKLYYCGACEAEWVVNTSEPLPSPGH